MSRARTLKVCIVSSCGGHLTEVRQLLPAYAGHDYFYVLNDTAYLPAEMLGRTYYIVHSERDLKFLMNLVEAVRLLRRERPDAILSTGAGPIVPFALVGRLVFGIKVLFIETFTRIDTPSLTARLMNRLAHRFYVQWPELTKWFPRSRFEGTVF